MTIILIIANLAIQNFIYIIVLVCSVKFKIVNLVKITIFVCNVHRDIIYYNKINVYYVMNKNNLKMKHYKHVIYAQIIVHNVEVTLTVINVYKDFIVKMEIVFNA